MGNLRQSVHSTEHTCLRHLFAHRRLELGLTQRALAKRLGVVSSFVGKVETGDRRLDVFEFVQYCNGLEWEAPEVLRELIEKCTQPQVWF
ncbi:helix-turn-helix domain-containing protein [Neisseria iguanae]|uniref:XRE family transcriptional regulator n=1 Tax=Neisseria iguanae TaxID=90242 RepID=A0A2P7U1K9_9NEIS|nr:helix-turn-helix transcriptional regulator [Neisseria iguanae]PSJ80857.1 XRE family transcriptional regulator [Neisseria iguanae]